MPIYIGTQKIDVSGMEKVYVGTQLVYQSTVALVSISTAGQTTNYYVGDTFSYNGTCTALYSDGSTATVTPTVSSPDMSTTGTKTVTLTYTENGITATTTYNITVTAVVLTSITLSGQTTSLNRGAAFSFGGTVTAHYNNSSTANVTSSTTFSGYNMNTAGTYTVTASYTEGGVTKTATYQLTVNKVWTQLWSGSKTISWTSSSSAPADVTVYSNSSLPNTSDIRITFTMSNAPGGGSAGQYLKTWQTARNNASNYTTTKPTSPLRGSSFNPNTMYYCLGVCNYTSSTYGGQQLFLIWGGSSDKKFYLHAVSSSSQYASSKTISITVTKIERYY